MPRYKISLEYDSEIKLFVPMYKKHWWNKWKPWGINYFTIGFKTAEEALKSITESEPYCYTY